MRRRETRLVSGREWYHYTEGLLHHAEKLAFFFFSERHRESKGGAERSIWKQFE